MAKFTLNWDNSAIVGKENINEQIASYRKRTTPAGDWLTDGFSPANNLPVSAQTTSTKPTLDNNTVYQLQVEAVCDTGGPTPNENGPVEAIYFNCALSTDANQVTVTAPASDSSTITVKNLTAYITQVKFLLWKVVVSGPAVKVSETTVSNTGTSVAKTVTGLVGATQYYWQYIMYATVSGVQVASSDAAYRGNACSPYYITTPAPPTCDAITTLSVSATNS